jgi:hypothetical protein
MEGIVKMRAHDSVCTKVGCLFRCSRSLVLRVFLAPPASSRRSASSRLSHFLSLRPHPADLMKSALALPAEQHDARKLERSATKFI